MPEDDRADARGEQYHPGARDRIGALRAPAVAATDGGKHNGRASARRGEVWKYRNEMNAAEQIDQDRRRGAACSQHHDHGGERIERACEPGGHDKPRADREDEPADEEAQRFREPRRRGADERPRTGASKASDRESRGTGRGMQHRGRRDKV
jgi:hypothetical protein